MIKNLYKRFLLWLLKPVLNELKEDNKILDRKVNSIESDFRNRLNQESANIHSEIADLQTR